MIKPRPTNNICVDLQNYMFTSKNIDNYAKHIIHFASNTITKPTTSTNRISTYIENACTPIHVETPVLSKKEPTKVKDTMYRPKQHDSLFWCFYILKNGFFNYEMEINNQYFVVEKKEKYKYIELIRQQKHILKLHKIKPFTEIEDDLANKSAISIKTFFALCALENINVMLVNKRKIYELLCSDIDEQHPLHIVHRTKEHAIELDPTEDSIAKYRDTYFKVSGFEATLKGIGSYKVDELMELCKQLDIAVNKGTKKLTKKDIYELLVMNF
jgi:hypothetical protein